MTTIRDEELEFASKKICAELVGHLDTLRHPNLTAEQIFKQGAEWQLQRLIQLPDTRSKDAKDAISVVDKEWGYPSNPSRSTLVGWEAARRHIYARTTLPPPARSADSPQFLLIRQRDSAVMEAAALKKSMRELLDIFELNMPRLGSGDSMKDEVAQVLSRYKKIVK